MECATIDEFLDEKRKWWVFIILSNWNEYPIESCYTEYIEMMNRVQVPQSHLLKSESKSIIFSNTLKQTYAH